MAEGQLAAVANGIKEKKVYELKSFIGDSYKSIVTDVPKAYLPEQVFVEYFLDFFKAGGHSDISTPLSLKWLEISGGPYNEVTIVDNNSNELYVVPSIYIKPDIDDGKLDSISLNDVSAEFKLREQRLPADANNYLNNKLNGLEGHVHTNFDKSVAMWKGIFHRYSKKSSVQQVSTGTTSKPALTALSDMLDYD